MKYTQDDIKKMVMETADVVAPRFGLDKSELAQISMGIIWKESRFNPEAENKNSSARGLFQVLINTQRESEKKYAKVPFAVAKYKSSYYPNAPVGKNDKMFDPRYNILIGMSYLAYQLRRYDQDRQKSIHAYNQGSYPGSWKFDGIKYADSVQTYISENLPISEFRSTNPIAQAIQKIKQKTTKSTAKVDKKLFTLNAQGSYY